MIFDASLAQQKPHSYFRKKMQKGIHPSWRTRRSCLCSHLRSIQNVLQPQHRDYGFWWFLVNDFRQAHTHTERRPAVEVQYNAKSRQMSVAEPSTKVHTSAIEGASLGGNC